MIIYNLNGQIIGTGSFKERILKFVVISPQFRETTAFAQVVTHLNNKILEKHDKIFVFTKPENSIMFQGLGFKEIAVAEPVFSVLEFGYKSIKNYIEYLESKKVSEKKKSVASIVVNCNPFSNGHKFLIEKASYENDIVYLFVVEEDKSVFSFAIRWELIKKGIAHLNNVVMIKGGDYVVSVATFPTYFVKNNLNSLVTQKQAEIDITVFVKYIVPTLNINKRYVGTEVYCPTTAAYNDAMKKILPTHNVEFIEVERKAIGTDSNNEPDYISASKIRNAIKEDKLESITKFLPDSTREFLLSDAASVIINNIKNSTDRH